MLSARSQTASEASKPSATRCSTWLVVTAYRTSPPWRVWNGEVPPAIEKCACLPSELPPIHLPVGDHDRQRGVPLDGCYALPRRQALTAVRSCPRSLHGDYISAHHPRRLKAKVMLSSDAQLSEVQDLLGHSSPRHNEEDLRPAQHLEGAFERFSLSPEELARGLGEE